MARHYHESIIKGEVDNRQPGRVTGRFWVVGQDWPIKLNLEGNSAPDIAGCLLEFFNPEPLPQDIAPLHRVQSGRVVSMTASKRLMDEEGTICNGLHLAWKSDQDGEILIESRHFKLRVLHHDWSVEDHVPQTSRLAHSEFQWETFLRHQPPAGESYLQQFASYVADVTEEPEDADYTRSIWDAADDLADILPNPATEGIDWLRDDLGDVHHPFTLVCRQFAMNVWRYCHSLDLFEAPDDPDIRELVEQVEHFSDRIATALDDLAYEERPDPAYVVANLKRAVSSLHEAMNAVHRVRQNSRLAAKCDAFAQQMFSLREQAIELMTHFRQL